MRRLVRHGLAGVGAATFAVVAGVTALGAPTTATLGVPATTVAEVVAPDPAVEAARSAAVERANRDAERTRVSDAAAAAATRRSSDLGAQSAAIGQRSDEIKAARAKAAVAAKKKAAAAKKRREIAIKNQGYTPGTTDVHEIARQILDNKYDYGSDQFSCFSWIISRESNWNIHATNASSGAYGLPQSLPGSKMATEGSDWRTNPATQINWGVKYMKSRYGSPCGAKSHWESAGNY